MTVELLTTVLVIVTAFYAWTTFRILKANERAIEVMKQQNDAFVRPYVNINTVIHPKHPMISLKITNEGKTPAKNLRLVIDKAFHQFGRDDENKNIANFPAFQEPIDCLPPGATLFFDLAQGFVIFGKDANPQKTPVKFSVKAVYSYAEKTVEEVTNIDLQPYLNSRSERNPIVEELGDIRKAIEGIKKN
ncbi:MAG: hypothetical protein HZB81_07880 [Deltaproteobacteria bacterium]|nr:hypothetical protein [Deltaproteobacteria bacterium]